MWFIGQIPGKVYKYAATNKTILFILDGEKEKLKKTFEKYNRYLFVDNNVNDVCFVLNNINQIRLNYNNEPIREFSSNNVASMIVEGFSSPNERDIKA